MKNKKVNAGRPTKFTDDVIRKIEEIAALDGTVEEMALYADLNPDTIYDWLKNKPEFSERITKLRNTPVLAIRRAVVEKAVENYSSAMDYLKRKRKTEFGDTQTIEHKLPTPLLNAVQNNNSNPSSDGNEEKD